MSLRQSWWVRRPRPAELPSPRTGRTYWAVVNEVSIALPPEEPGQAPRMEVRRVLHIGDEMKAGAFVHPMTPAFRGFSF